MPATDRRRFLATALLAPGAWAAEPRAEVVLPRHLRAADPQLPYVRQLVQLALSKAGSPRAVRLVDLEMAQGRSLVELAQGRSPFDLMWTVTDRQRESSGLIPVRFPIDRGLMGWRLLLVRARDLGRWQHVDLDTLRQRTAGQGHDWPDTAVLRANGLPVGTSSSYESLFRMLGTGRFDYFPRAILEVDAELAGNAHPELAIAPGVLLHYPAAAYLFVSPRRPELAEELARGLDLAAADGSFQRLHREFFGPVLRAHPVLRERVIHLNNPLLPEQTPLQRHELWLQPGEV